MVKIIYDGEGAVFGRLASVVAKDLLKGENVDVVNCEKIIISGDKKLLAKKILTKREMGSGGSMKGPKYPRVADKLVKRMIRGMLPRDRAKGRDAFRNLKCYVGGKSEGAVKLNHRKPMRFVSVEEIVRLLK
ncbi:50S ribosomal protein L13 [archaeon]|nr:50S ribosomal protein L13 [archaeon]